MLQHKFNKKAEDDVATAKRRGLMAPKDKAAWDAVGTGLENHPVANVAIPAATVTTLASLTLTEGTWELSANMHIQCGAAGGAVDVYYTGPPGWGIVEQTLAANEQRTFPLPGVMLLVAPGGSTVVAVKAYATVAMTGIWAMGLQAGAFAGLDLRAWRLK